MNTREMYTQKIESAAGLIGSEPEAAQTELEDIVSQIAAEPQPNSLGEDMADAEEYLAEIALKASRWDEAIVHSQRAVLAAQRFRPKAHFLAAEALASLGQNDLAISKLELVASWSKHRTLAAAAQRRIESLRPEG
jgi:tetratricopeptide (TPR) repeat protein